MRKILLTWLCFTTTAMALPNPAATNCINKGFKYLLVNNVGVCLFPDHSYCEEWAFFRGQCKPGQKYPTFKPQNSVHKS